MYAKLKTALIIIFMIIAALYVCYKANPRNSFEHYAGKLVYDMMKSTQKEELSVHIYEFDDSMLITLTYAHSYPDIMADYIELKGELEDLINENQDDFSWYSSIGLKLISENFYTRDLPDEEYMCFSSDENNLDKLSELTVNCDLREFDYSSVVFDAEQLVLDYYSSNVSADFIKCCPDIKSITVSNHIFYSIKEILDCSIPEKCNITTF